jgi:hypothetical protein
VIVPDIVQHVGRFCEVATRNGRFFGELVRLSAGVFLVRSVTTASRQPIVKAEEIAEITDLAVPHL